MSLSLADIKRAWLLRMLGVSSSALTNSDLEMQVYSAPDPYVKDSYKANGVIAATLDRRVVSSNTMALTSGRLNLGAVYLTAGTVITSISFWSGNVAMVAPTNQWFCLYDANLNKLAVTADDGVTVWNTLAEKNLALTAQYTVPTSGLYYIGICVVAGTTISLAGIISLNQVNSQPPALTGNSTTGLTNPASAPNTAAAFTVQNAIAMAGVK